jgi:hypothetical protein
MLGLTYPQLGAQRSRLKAMERCGHGVSTPLGVAATEAGRMFKHLYKLVHLQLGPRLQAGATADLPLILLADFMAGAETILAS